MKIVKAFVFIIMIITAFLIYTYRTDIIVFLYEKSMEQKNIEIANEYERDQDFNFVKQTSTFIPTNYQDVLNIFYTVLNKGYNRFTFYCHPDYKECLRDVTKLANDQTILSNINNFVHPFNNYRALEIKSNALGEISINIEKMYTEDEIKTISDKVDEVIKSKIKSNMSDKTKIKVIHDYIINNTKYDKEGEKIIENDSTFFKYSSNKASGPVMYNLALCGGYTDYMMLFLDKLNILSFKVSSDNHIWNVVNLDGKWYHLDLTWDDPVTNNNQDILLHDYFLITTDKLLKKDKTEHTFDEKYFSEVKA